MAGRVTAAQDRADRVNLSLPVNICAEDVLANEQFSQLLSQLSEHLTDTGMSIGAQQEVQEAQEALKQEKLTWLQQHVLHSELQDHLFEQPINPDDPASRDFYRTASECYSMAEIQDFLDCHPDPTNDITLLGLKADNFARQHSLHKYNMASMQNKLIPELEERLGTRCETVMSFFNSGVAGTEGSAQKFARAQQLPELLATEILKRDTEKKKLKKGKMARERQFEQYHQVLTDTLLVLQKLILNHRLQAKPESDVVTNDWLTTRCDAMCLKIRLVELHILCDTYSSEAVKALKVIRNHLDASTDNTLKELAHVEQSLNSYALAGSEFEGLVREYTELRDEIENKKWGLQTLTQQPQ